MKASLNRFLTLLFAVMVSSTVMAQSAYGNYKFGHINLSDFLEKMPEYATCLYEIKELSKHFQERLDQMGGEHQIDVNYYNSMQAQLDKTALDELRMKIEEQENLMKEYAREAENDINRAYKEKLNPIVEKVENAVKSVGKKSGYTYIFYKVDDYDDTYINNLQTTDVTPLIKKELGIK